MKQVPQSESNPRCIGEAEPCTETILVVEDDHGMRRVVVRQMTALGYQVLEASDGAAALTVLDHCEVDLLFTDVVMPGGVGGPELARAATERRPGLKVLFTTGFSATMTDSDGQVGDGVRLLTKPYRREDLARALRRALAS
jgi:CheY-like chemotaxis protein